MDAPYYNGEPGACVSDLYDYDAAVPDENDDEPEEVTMSRYEIRMIRDLDSDGLSSLGEVLAETDDAGEAAVIADRLGPRETYGVVIVDTVDREIDWGSGVTAL